MDVVLVQSVIKKNVFIYEKSLFLSLLMFTF